jgi:hypothetical protein
MAKENKRKLIFITLIAITLLSSSAYASLMPNAHATEVTASTAKGLAIINQVAGINLTKYDATPTLNVASSYLGVLPTENIRYTLTGLGNTIEIQDTFTNGHLLMMTVLEDSRSTQMSTLPAEIASKLNMSRILVQMAKAFLLNYQEYSANSFYSQLASTLNNADPTKNSTTNIGYINFEINIISGNSSTLGNSTTFTWSYTANGVDAHCKCVSLSYKNGFLNRFFDSWSLYPIGSTAVNLSKQQAEEIAMQNAKAYSWAIGSGSEKRVINNFTVTKPMVEQLVFCPVGSGPNARSSYPLTLYPMWSIGVGLDKFYPGNVYGIYVDIWADTGQVRNIQEVFSTLPPPADAKIATIEECSIINNQTSGIASSFPDVWAIIALAAFAIGAVPVWLSLKKPSYNMSLPKLRKTSGLMLCILMISVALIAIVSAVPTVNAADSCVDIWADSHPEIPEANYTNPHTPNEIGNQTAICDSISSLFGEYGYDNYNHQPSSNTTADYVFYDTHLHEQNHIAAATVWFDHGIGINNDESQPKISPCRQIPNWEDYGDEFHFMLVSAISGHEDYGRNAFDYQIYDQTSKGNNYFSFISACLSASLEIPSGHGYTGSYGENPYPSHSGAPIGMPYAWTHNASMSNYGYAYPDSGAYCYIGFSAASPPLSQTSPPLYSYYPDVYFALFVQYFFDAAFSLHDSVNQALDYASGMCWGGQLFQNTVLYSGFCTYWPHVGSGSGRMFVYGNGNMHLYTGSPDYITPPTITHNVPAMGVVGQQYQFSASATDPCGYNLTYTYNYGDGSGWTTETTHTYNSPSLYTVYAEAQSSTGLTCQNSTTVAIGNVLTVQAILNGLYPIDPNVYVDSNPVGTAPISVPVSPGYHTVAVDTPIYGWANFLYFVDQNYNCYYNGESIQVTSPKTLTACYVWSGY